MRLVNHRAAALRVRAWPHLKQTTHAAGKPDLQGHAITAAERSSSASAPGLASYQHATSHFFYQHGIH